MPSIDQLLTERFGFHEFRPGQRQVIEALLAGRSALAVFPTGGGKSICYQLPALEIEGLTLVVSPLIALMKDQIDFLTSKGIPAARLDSSLSADEVVRVSEGVRSGATKLLYVAPERFNNERFVSEMRRTKIALFAIDEAHCISEWGHNFRPDYLKLAETAKELGAERVLALTATATPAVVRDICKAFAIAPEDAVVTGFYRYNLTLFTTPTSPAARDQLLLQRLRERPAGPTIVYVTLQKTAEHVAEYLGQHNLAVQPYHAGMEADRRHEIQDWWMKEPAGIVVATIAFGMGIDKSNVRYVYHYNLPKGLESYSQEIGRAGRDGQPSTVELFACREDLPVLQNFTIGDTPDPSNIRRFVQDLAAGPDQISPSIIDLSNRYDMRSHVMKTTLTYLELLGVLKQGTPFYAGYEAKPITPIPLIAKEFPGEHGEFVREMFNHAKRGRIWYGFNPEELASRLNVERKRIIRALEVMQERGMIELRAGDVRTPYDRLRTDIDVDEISDELNGRFAKREQQELERLQQVIDLVELEGCQTNFLVAHFGELRDKPCGHCTYCLTKTRQRIGSSSYGAINLDIEEVRKLQHRSPKEMQSPKQIARVLCGLTSPSFSKLRISREPLFGNLEAHPYSDVLAWCELNLSPAAAM